MVESRELRAPAGDGIGRLVLGRAATTREARPDLSLGSARSGLGTARLRLPSAASLDYFNKCSQAVLVSVALVAFLVLVSRRGPARALRSLVAAHGPGRA